MEHLLYRIICVFLVFDCEWEMGILASLLMFQVYIQIRFLEVCYTNGIPQLTWKMNNGEKGGRWMSELFWYTVGGVKPFVLCGPFRQRAMECMSSG